MSDAASNYLENKLLDHVLRFSTASYTAPGTVYCALFSGTAATVKTALESGTSSTSGSTNWGLYEITSASAYARQAITFGVAGATTPGQITKTTTITFPVATADYNNTATSGSTVTCLAIMDASTAGNVLFYGELAVSKQVSSGDQFTIASGNLTVQLA
jgi:hypothetical protein